MDKDTLKLIEEAAEKKANFINAYTMKKTEQINENLILIDRSFKNFKNEIESLIEKQKNSGEYSDYVKYLVSEDFEKKQQEFIEKVEKTVIDNLPKKNNNMLFIYVAVGILFLLQIALFVLK